MRKYNEQNSWLNYTNTRKTRLLAEKMPDKPHKTRFYLLVSRSIYYTDTIDFLISTAHTIYEKDNGKHNRNADIC